MKIGKKLTYQGKQYSIAELARILNVGVTTFRYRLYRYGLDMAAEISLMPEKDQEAWRIERRKDAGYETTAEKNRAKARRIKYKGVIYTSKQLAEVFEVKNGTFLSWLNRYGEDEAIRLGEMNEQQRHERKLQSLRDGQRRGRSAIDNPLPANDPDYELKNRINSWRQQGWSDDEIIVKASMI